MKKIKLGVLISGSGSNLQAIIDRIEAGRLSAEIVVVVSNEPDAYGLTRARQHGLPNMVIDHRQHPDRESFERQILEVLRAHQVELVALAGFMRMITSTLIDAFPHRIMNIHPAILPAFPGTHVWQQQLDYGIKFAGCTVHFVDRGMDTGPIIIQAVVPVLDEDTADTLAARILKQEHRIYSAAIQLFAEDRLRVQGRKVKVMPPIPVSEEMVMLNPPLTTG